MKNITYLLIVSIVLYSSMGMADETTTQKTATLEQPLGILKTESPLLIVSNVGNDFSSSGYSEASNAHRDGHVGSSDHFPTMLVIMGSMMLVMMGGMAVYWASR